MALNLGTISLQRHGRRSLHQQVFDAIRDAILTGRLPPGALLPSTRLLAEELGVSRNTTTAVFEQLTADGLVVTAVGSGTRVTSSIPPEFLALTLTRAQGSSTAAAGLRPFSSLARQLPTFEDSRTHSMPRPFTPGVPAIDQFPINVWTGLTSRRWRTATVADLCSPPAVGAEDLRAAVASHAGSFRGAVSDAANVLIVTGAQQALDFAARVLTDPGEVCWIEEPGYLGARHALTMAGLKLVPAVVDDRGLDVERAVRTLPVPRLIYVTPSHQYPLGGMLSLERRIALLQYADRVGAWILEDDYDSEYAYAGSPVSCLQGLDATGRVVYVGSFNKTLFPALRLGYLLVPKDLVEAFRAVRTHADGHPTAVIQTVLAEFITSGGFASHLRRMRAIYTDRRDALVDSLTRHLPGLEIGVHDRGMHFVAYLPEQADDRTCSDLARSAGTIVPPLSRYYIGPAERRGLIFGFACVPIPEIEPAVKRLAVSLAQQPAP
jgi:GntR family transcriptional regulator/MocR family aminotransferase